jgi:GT2 family glycosyltransferase
LSSNDTYPQHVVTAVIVAHDGAAWLPRVIGSLLEQSRPVQRVVAVDTGSRDRSGSVLAGLLGQSVVFGMDRGTGYGAAVARALQHRAANLNVPVPAARQSTERVEWVWLLHDDSEPAPDALEQLLRGAAETRAAGVLGPKVKDWSDQRVILEAGVTIDTVGRRITGIEPREVDQGQHDGDRDCLAVGSAGMLVRRDVWEMVGGFDPEMALFREDVDFCWRVHAAGYRVRLITDAVVYHVEASARRRRPISVARRPHQIDRRNAMLTLMGNLPALPMLASAAGNFGISLMRTLFFLLAKRLAAALDELSAVGSVFGHPLRLLALRSRRARGRRSAYGRVRNFIPPGRSPRRIAELAAAAMSKSAQADTAGAHHATDDPDEADFLLTDTGLVQRILTNPGVLLFIGLTVVSLVAERALLGSGPLGGGELIPAWGGASGLWQEYLQAFHPVGVGSGSSAPPYLAVIAALATLLGGKPWLAVDVILLGCVPLAGISAFLAVRRVTRSTPIRVWAAASYALLPVAMGAIAAGRIGTAVVFILTPAIALLAGRMLTQPPRRARRAAWATALTVAVAAAFVPLVWIVILLSAVALAAARPAMWRNLAIVVAVPPVLLLPWTVQAAAAPGGLLLEAGLQQPGLATRDLPARSLMLLSPGGPGLPPVWVTAGIVLAALAALLLARRRALMIVGWGIALSGLLVAVAVSRLVVTPGNDEPVVTAWPGVALLIAAVGLLLAGATAGDAIPRLARGARGPGGGDSVALSGSRKGARGPRGLRGLGVLLLCGMACSAPVLAAASWLVGGVRGPVGPVSGPIIPAVVSASLGNGLQQRTLVLRSAGSQVSFSLQRGISPSLGDPALAPVPASQHALTTAVAALVAPDGGDAVNQAQLLAQFDIGFVLLPGPVDQNLARVLSGVSGLRLSSYSAAFVLWKVTELSARVRVVEPSGAVVAVASGPVGVSGARAPAAGGTLELAEPAGGWNATLNGQPLTRVTSPAGGWAQAFRLPPGGGVLEIGRSQTGRDLILVFELLAVLVVAGLALPGARGAAEESGGTAAGSHGRRGVRERPAALAASTAAGTAETGDDGPPGSPAGGGGGTRERIPARDRAGHGQRRVRGKGPAKRRDRRAASKKPGAGGAGRRSATPAGPPVGEAAGAPPRPRAPRAAEETAAAGAGWPEDDAAALDAGWPSGGHAGWPDDEPAAAGAGWPSDGRDGWPEDEPGYPAAGWPSGGHAGWPQDEPAAADAGWADDEPAAAGTAGWPSNQSAGWPSAGPSGWPEGEHAGSPPPAARSPSGTWPPPGQGEPWQPADRGGWVPDQTSAWVDDGGEVLDPLPPAGGSRHRRPDHDDDRWPASDRDPRGDAW